MNEGTSNSHHVIRQSTSDIVGNKVLPSYNLGDGDCLFAQSNAVHPPLWMRMP
jgi:hypothetical protein